MWDTLNNDIDSGKEANRRGYSMCISKAVKASVKRTKWLKKGTFQYLAG